MDSGSRQAMVDWDVIVQRDGPAVWRTVFRLLGNHADAEDCFQETFLAAMDVFRRERVEHPRALLHRLATARAMDRLRQRYRRAGKEDAADWSGVSAPQPHPAIAAEAAELSERLRQALAELPGNQAEAFCLHNLEDWSYQEIATHLGSTSGAVGLLLHRARARLRTLLAQETDEGIRSYEKSQEV